MTNVEVTGNIAHNSGGGVFVGESSTATITDSVISGNGGGGGTPQLDIENFGFFTGAEGCAPFDGSLYQGFLAPATSLSRIDLQMFGPTGPDGETVHINIRRGGPEGPIVAESTGYLPASQPASSQSVTFPVRVNTTAGELLVIEVDDLGGLEWVRTVSPGSYAPAISWAACGGGGSPLAQADTDYDFKSFTWNFDIEPGGGVFNSGTMTLDNTVVSDNVALEGGAIHNSGDLDIVNFRSSSTAIPTPWSRKAATTSHTCSRPPMASVGGISAAWTFAPQTAGR